MNKNEIKLSNGMEMPRLGMGTWFLGEKKQKDAQETAALRAGIDAGIRLIDTAEMYGDGKSEQLIGRAIKGYDRSRGNCKRGWRDHHAFQGSRRTRRQILP